MSEFNQYGEEQYLFRFGRPDSADTLQLRSVLEAKAEAEWDNEGGNTQQQSGGSTVVRAASSTKENKPL